MTKTRWLLVKDEGEASLTVKGPYRDEPARDRALRRLDDSTVVHLLDIRNNRPRTEWAYHGDAE